MRIMFLHVPSVSESRDRSFEKTRILSPNPEGARGLNCTAAYVYPCDGQVSPIILTHEKMHRGVVTSVSHFTSGAFEYTADLLDGQEHFKVHRDLQLVDCSP